MSEKAPDDPPRAGSGPATPSALPPLARDELFERLWEATVERWDDLPAHQAVLGRAVDTEALADLAARYRALAREPEKKERAEERLQVILAAATSLMFSKKSVKTEKAGMSKLTWITLFSCAAALFQLLQMLIARR